MTDSSARIRVAKHAGFCFGVKRATDCVEEALRSSETAPAEGKRERICTLGNLIHNEPYLAMLRQRGVCTVEEEGLDELIASAGEDAPVKLFIRAHGIPRELEEKLARGARENPHFSFVDCTCPFVRKIQSIAAEYSGEEHLFLLMGSEGHPEVTGILSHCRSEFFVFAHAEELLSPEFSTLLRKYAQKTPVLAAQTTQNLTEWKKAQEILKKLCTNARIFDTICSVTEKRQTEAAKLARECDRMIVIGGRASSNTAKLFAVCKAGCDRTVWISRAEELASVFPLREIAETHQRVGIAAGASTPSGIIEEVYKNMCEFENFAELLESSIKTLNTGDIVTGIVTSVTDGELQLDLGAKVTGVITADQVADTPVKLTEQFKIGDTVEAFVIRVSDLDGFATLSKKRVDSNKNWVKVQEACDTAEILTGTVVEAVKGGVVINYDAVRIFVPGSHTGIAKDGDLTVLVGQEVRFRVIEIKDQGRGKRAIGSIRVVQREERRAAETEFWANIEEGKTYTGTVKSMTSYGAFIDLGGVDGMVHKSELSWRPISTPASVLAIGDTITVFVKSFDAEKKRISLGYKTEETNPWYQFIHTYGVGDVATVKVVSMMPFGAFAEILPGVDGLIHISQIALNKIAKPADVLEIGQEVDAKIIGIDEEKQKISLSIRALLEETEVEEAAAETEE